MAKKRKECACCRFSRDDYDLELEAPSTIVRKLVHEAMRMKAPFILFEIYLGHLTGYIATKGELREVLTCRDYKWGYLRSYLLRAAKVHFPEGAKERVGYFRLTLAEGRPKLKVRFLRRRIRIILPQEKA